MADLIVNKLTTQSHIKCHISGYKSSYEIFNIDGLFYFINFLFAKTANELWNFWKVILALWISFFFHVVDYFLILGWERKYSCTKWIDKTELNLTSFDYFLLLNHCKYHKPIIFIVVSLLDLEILWTKWANINMTLTLVTSLYVFYVNKLLWYRCSFMMFSPMYSGMNKYIV